MAGQRLEMFERVTKLVSMAAVPIVLAFMGHYVTVAVRNAEIRAQLVELAVGVLSEPPSEEFAEGGTDPVRQWAIETLEKEMGVQFDERTSESLQMHALRVGPRFGSSALPVDNTRFLIQPIAIPFGITTEGGDPAQVFDFSRLQPIMIDELQDIQRRPSVRPDR